jgi:hypothetical protein
MPTRFNFPSSGAAPVSPAFGAAWDVTSGAVRLPLTRGAGSTGSVTLSNDTTSGEGVDADHLVAQYVSETIAAQTISAQAIDAQFRCQEANVASNQFLTLHIYVVSNDGSTVRGTILALTRDDTEMSASAQQNRRFTATTSSVTAQNGDRIVVEVGTGGNPASGGTHDVAFSVRDNSTDLPEDDTQTTTGNPWLEFTNEITGFGTPPDSGTTHELSGTAAMEMIASGSIQQVTGPAGFIREGAYVQQSTGGLVAQNVALADFDGTTPKAALFYLNGSTAAGFAGGDIAACIGFATATFEGGIQWGEDDAVASANNVRGNSATKAIRILSPDGATLAEADVTFSADTVTITWTTNDNVARWITVVALGGESLEVAAGTITAPGATGAQVTSGLGITPVALIMLGSDQTTAGFNFVASLSYGAASGAAEQWCASVASAEPSNPANTHRSLVSDAIIRGIAAATGLETNRAALSAFGAGSFTLDWSVVAVPSARYHYLAIGGEGVEAFAFTDTVPTTAQAKSTLGAGFLPKLVLTASVCNVVASGIAAHARLSFGMYDGSVELCHWAGATDAVTPTSLDLHYTQLRAIAITDANAPSSTGAIGDISFVADGISTNWTVNGNPYAWAGLMLTGPAVSTGSPGTTYELAGTAAMEMVATGDLTIVGAPEPLPDSSFTIAAVREVRPARVYLHQPNPARLRQVITAATINRSYATMKVTQCSFTFPTTDAEPMWRELDPRTGRLIVVESTSYPLPWVGGLVEWSEDGNGKGTVVAASYDSIFAARLLPASTQVAGAVGQVFRDLIAMTNQLNPTNVEIGSVQAGPYVEHDFGDYYLWDALTEMCRAIRWEWWLEYEVRPEAVYATAHLAPKRGQKRHDVTLSEGPETIERLGSKISTAGLTHKIRVVGGQERTTQAFADRPRGEATIGDAVLSSNELLVHGDRIEHSPLAATAFTRRDRVMILDHLRGQASVDLATDRLLAEPRVAERMLKLRALSDARIWRNIRPGDSVTVDLPEPALITGFRGPVRILETQPMEESGYMEFDCQVLTEV